MRREKPTKTAHPSAPSLRLIPFPTASTPGLIVLQKRGHRAGAQTCLARLLRDPVLADVPKTLVTGEQAWLSETAREAGVEVIIKPFPAVRTIWSRSVGNGAWSRSLVKRLADAGRAGLVLGNDLPEGPLAHQIASRLPCRSGCLLRSSGMQARDLKKYDGDNLDYLFPVNRTMADQVRGWLARFSASDTANARVEVLADGLEDADFAVRNAPSKAFPERILVIGNEHPAKGWGDFVDAWARLPEPVRARIRQIDFLASGRTPDKLRELGAKLGTVRARVSDFRAAVSDYDLAIAPSRRESFGMAVLETLAAGVPVLSTQVGVIGRVLDAEWCVPPNDPPALAAAIVRLAGNWPGEPGGRLHAIQRQLRAEFMISDSARQLKNILKEART